MIVTRPDLSARTFVSKSAISGFEWCQTRSWFEKHDPRPTIKTERMVFGSALDAGIEQILIAQRAGIPMAEARWHLAAAEVMERDEIEINLEEIAVACAHFIRDVIPRYDWAVCGLQVHMHEDLPLIGESDGHPDIYLADGSIFDVKSASKRKGDTDAATSIELGFYALLSEARGTPCPRVGYFTWVRSSKPAWQILEAPVTDEMRRRTTEVALAYVRARAADELLNRGQAQPLNWSFNAGPKFPGLCSDCAFNPAFGGPCAIAIRGDTDA